MQGWAYETSFTDAKPGIWMLGWDSFKPYPTDAQVAATALRHGNFDYVTNTVKWSPVPKQRGIDQQTALWARIEPAR